MFSDRARTLKMVVAALAMLGLSVQYTHFTVERRGSIHTAFENPARYDGMPITFSLWEVTEIRTPNVYTISKTLRGVTMEGASEGLRVGDTVTIHGVLRASDRRVVVLERIAHPNRRTKGVLSILALLGGLICAPRWFGVESGRVVLRG